MERKHVVIVGGGFGGLYAGRALKNAPVRVTLIDRRNHHLFQPLLYEVATAALSPADIAEPIRRVFSKQKNADVLLAEAKSIDLDNQRVILSEGAIDFDYLILATGQVHSYFGNDDWKQFAPGLKTAEDAIEVRRRFLLAFERAEREADEVARRAELTFVVVGAGPTGVELAGTMSEIARRSIPRDFRMIDTKTTRVILIEGDDRVLPAYSRELSEKALKHLQSLGVEVLLNTRATKIDERGVMIGDERIEAANVFWAAGVKASPITKSLGVELDKGGRVKVEPDLTVPGHNNIFVIGDIASVKDPKTGEQVPGIAPAAIQMGKYAAKVIKKECEAAKNNNCEAASDERKPFHFVDKGMLATIGRAKAVGTIFGVRVSGLIAWLAWAGIHIFFLIGFRNRLIVVLRWAWAYFIFQRGARLITGDVDLRLERVKGDTNEKSENRLADSPEFERVSS